MSSGDEASWRPHTTTVEAFVTSCPVFNGALAVALDHMGLDPQWVRVPDPALVLASPVADEDSLVGDLVAALIQVLQSLNTEAATRAPLVQLVTKRLPGLDAEALKAADLFELLALTMVAPAGRPGSRSVGRLAHVADPAFFASCLGAMHEALRGSQALVPPCLRLYWLRAIVAAAQAPEEDRRAMRTAPSLPTALGRALPVFVPTTAATAVATHTGGRSASGSAGSSFSSGTFSGHEVDSVTKDHVQHVQSALQAVSTLCTQVHAAGGGAGAVPPPVFDPASVQRDVWAMVQKHSHGASRNTVAAARCAAIALQIRHLKVMTKYLQDHAAVLQAASPMVWQALLEYLLCAQGSPRNGTIHDIENRAAIAKAEPVHIIQTAVVPAAALAALEEFAGRSLLSARALAREQEFLGTLSPQVQSILRAAATRASTLVEARALGSSGSQQVLQAMLGAIHGLTALTAKYEFQTVVPDQLQGCTVLQG